MCVSAFVCVYAFHYVEALNINNSCDFKWLKLGACVSKPAPAFVFVCVRNRRYSWPQEMPAKLWPFHIHIHFPPSHHPQHFTHTFPPHKANCPRQWSCVYPISGVTLPCRTMWQLYDFVTLINKWKKVVKIRTKSYNKRYIYIYSHFQYNHPLDSNSIIRILLLLVVKIVS